MFFAPISKKKLAKVGRTVLHKINEHLVSVRPFKECFPDANTIPTPISIDTVHTPEAVWMPFNYNARKFKNPVYKMPDRYSSVLGNGRLNTTYNVIVNQDNVILKDSINSISNAWYFNWRAIRRNRTESLNGICTPFRSVSNEFYHTIFSNLFQDSSRYGILHIAI